VKARVEQHLSRGKVDLNVAPAGGSAALSELSIDQEVASRYRQAATQLTEQGVSGHLDVGSLLSLPGVTRLVEAELSREDFAAGLAQATGVAIAGLCEMRASEGEALAAEFDSRLDSILALVDELESRSGTVQRSVREKLRKRSEQLREETGLLDEARLHQEIVIAADRLDITEELVRLRSHVDQFRAILAGERSGDAREAVGRRLDFLLQEMGREANTVGSKANDAPLAHNVVELKTELERIREQAQNVE
jgi:uncharacterized protein (TIGR00255 family)